MIKNIFTLILLLILGRETTAQVKQFITIPKNKWEFTDQAAANVYLAAREGNLKDTVVYVYLRKSVYWTIKQTDGIKLYQDNILTFNFTVDSIRGTDNQRQVLLTIIYKTADSTAWCKWKSNYVATGDTVTTHRFDSLGRTTDSTSQESYWLKFTSSDQTHVANPIGVGAGNYIALSVSDLGQKSSLMIWLEKVYGSATLYKGIYQQARLHFQLRAEPPQEWIDKYLNIALPPIFTEVISIDADNRDGCSTDYPYETPGTIGLGYDTSNRANILILQAGFQFKLNIDQGKTIDTAIMNLACDLYGQTSWFPTDNISIRVEDVDNAVPFLEGNHSTMEDRALLVNESIDWSNLSTVVGSLNISPNIGPLLQKVIKRPNWKANNYVCVILKAKAPIPGHHMNINDHEHGLSAKLKFIHR